MGESTKISQGYFTTLHLSDDKLITKFLTKKHLTGCKKIQSICSILKHRILHFMHHRVWINNKKIIGLTYQKKALYKSQTENKQNMEKAWTTMHADIHAYLKLFAKTKVKSKISKILNSSAGFFFSNQNPEIDTQIFQNKEFNRLFCKLSKDSVHLNFSNARSIPVLWKNFSPYCTKPRSKQRLTKIILSYLISNEQQVKQNFAYMHAESSLHIDPLLKKYNEGGEKQLTGPYFLHFLRQSLDDSKIINLYEKSITRYQQIALKHDDERFSQENKMKLIDEEVKEHLEKFAGLQPGEAALFMTNWYAGETKISAHALTYIIKKELNNSFTFIVVNSSKISNKFVSTWFDPVNKKIKIHPFYILENISAEKLLSTKLWHKWVMMTWRMHILKSFNDMHEFEFPLLQGQKQNVNPSVETFITPQRSGSCPWSFYTASLRYFLSFKKYKETIFRMKVKSIIHFYELFKDRLSQDVEVQKLLKVSLAEHENRIKKPSYKEFSNLITPQELISLDEIIAISKNLTAP